MLKNLKYLMNFIFKIIHITAKKKDISSTESEDSKPLQEKEPSCKRMRTD